MLLLGLVLGAIVGSIAGVEGAVVGAVIGTVIGAVVAARRTGNLEERLGSIEEQLALLRSRLEVIEEGRASTQAPERPTNAPYAPSTVAATVASPPMPSAPTIATAATRAPLPAGVIATPLPAGVSAIGRDAGVARDASDTPTEAARVAPATTAGEARQPSAGTRARTTRPAKPEPTPSPIVAWLLGGNTLVRAGVVVLFFGVAFLLKYASEHVHVPIEQRLIAVAAGAIALLVLGWRLRERRAGYALALQGGSVGLLYLTVFAAFRLYGLLGPVPAFVLLVAIAAFSAALAVLQDAKSLAVAGVTGGFLAPLLASTGTGSHVMLFGYYVVLNAGIVAIALLRSWRVLNLVGFAFTFVIGGFWGANFYRPELFASTQPFLIAFFLMYVAVAVLFALREAPRLRDYVDATIVFGTPLAGFWYQSRLVHGMELGAALSAAVLAFFYLLLARVLYVRKQESLRMLVESFLALGVAFATLAIPLAADGRWTAAAWAMEGAAILWVGARQARLLPQACGMLLQLAAGIAYLVGFDRPSADIALLNSRFVGGAIIALGGLFCAWYATRSTRRSDWHPGACAALCVWGLVWWCGNGLREIERFVPSQYAAPAALVFLVATACVFSVLHRRLAWAAARHVPALVLPVIGFAIVLMLLDRTRPFANGGWLAWPIALAAHFWVLRRHERDLGAAATWYHAAGVWVLAVIGARELAWTTGELVQGSSIWRAIAWAIVPAGLLAWLAQRGERLAWPIAAWQQSYLLKGAIPLAMFAWLWILGTSLSSRGDPAPLPYVPLVNPLEVAQVGAALALVAWLLRVRRVDATPLWLRPGTLLHGGVGLSAFVWANGVLLRTLHHHAGVAFRLDAILRSTIAQSAFSIFWTLLALVTMVVATRLRLRPMWLAGAALMGVVVVKLFFVDLSNVGGIGRIVSFIGVGLLMLLIGYLSPVPPRAEKGGS